MPLLIYIQGPRGPVAQLLREEQLDGAGKIREGSVVLRSFKVSSEVADSLSLSQLMDLFPYVEG